MSLIESKLGWMCVFYFFIVMVGRHPAVDLRRLSAPAQPQESHFKSCVPQTSGSILFIIPLLVREVGSMLQERRARRHQL